ncbi:MAG: LptF/LptG family permease [Phycisphaerales bacterium]|nr:LptF/LptG family permease [Phycisphaerales bacterium]
MPWRLHRYLLLELLRIIGLTAAVLVVVTAFGAVIKPLATGVPLSPTQALTYVSLSTVPMLQYALPFAGGFGATLVLHRLAADNEVVAMAAAGLPYRVILVPVAALSLVLAIVLTILANTAIPRVYATMGRLLAGDMVSIMEHSVANGQPMSVGDLQIWAAGIRSGEQDATGTKRLQLDKVAAARVGSDGSILGDVSARAAVLEIDESDGLVEVRLVMEDAVSWDARGGGLRGFPRIEPTRPILVPMPERVEPMAMTRSELLEVAAHCDRYPPIAQRLTHLRDAIARHEGLSRIREDLQSSGVLKLQSMDQTGRVWLIEAADLVGDALRGGDQGVRIRQLTHGREQMVFHPGKAQLHLPDADQLSADGGSGLVLIMEDVRIETSSEDGKALIPPNHRASVDVANLRTSDDLSPDGLKIDDPMARGRELASVDRSIAKLVHQIDALEANLQGQVVSRLWRRWAVGITAGLLPLLGAVLALLMRHAQPLAVYMVGFLPGLADLVLISAGAGSMRQGSYAGGLLLMWSGSLLVVLATFIVWWRLRRN